MKAIIKTIPGGIAIKELDLQYIPQVNDHIGIYWSKCHPEHIYYGRILDISHCYNKEDKFSHIEIEIDDI